MQGNGGPGVSGVKRLLIRPRVASAWANSDRALLETLCIRPRLLIGAFLWRLWGRGGGGAKPVTVALKAASGPASPAVRFWDPGT